MKNFTLKFALFLLLGVGLVSTAAAQQIGGHFLEVGTGRRGIR